jgi:Uncharacterized protein conserved in bacteria (DUF2188)
MGKLHVVPNGSDRWAVRQERDGGIVGEYLTEAEAEAAAQERRLLDDDIEVVVHDRFGRTRRADH